MKTNVIINLKVGDKIALNNVKTIAEIDENIINFTLDDMVHTFDVENEIFTRENNEYKLELDIKEMKCELTLILQNVSTDILVDKANLVKKDNSYILTYLIETSDEPIELTVTKEEK